MKLSAITKFFLTTLFCACITSCTKENNPVSCPICANPFVDNSTTIVIERVIDGDTYDFRLGTDEFGIRLPDVDCYETRRTNTLKEQAQKAGITEDSALALGFEAKALANSLLQGVTVTIIRDTSQDNLDAFGRLLRHVILPNGKNVADTLLARGLVAP